MTTCSDITELLDSLPEEGYLDRQVNKPFVQIGEDVHRKYDVVYTLGNLTVFVELELGKKLPENQTDYLVTAEQQAAYDKAKPKLDSDLVIHNQGTPYIEGPLVDSAEDTELLTGRVRSILVEYGGLNFSAFQQREWMHGIVDMKTRYDLEITKPSDGYIDPHDQTKRPNSVIMKKTETGYEGAIRIVYKQGSALERAQAGIVQEATARVAAQLSLEIPPSGPPS